MKGGKRGDFIMCIFGNFLWFEQPTVWGQEEGREQWSSFQIEIIFRKGRTEFFFVDIDVI